MKRSKKREWTRVWSGGMEIERMGNMRSGGKSDDCGSAGCEGEESGEMW